MNTFRINFQTATRLVLGFLTQKRLFEIAKAEAIGGTISKESLRGSRLIYKGNMAWFCRTGNGEFYLAFEDGEYDTNSPASEPKQTELKKPTCIFKYTGDQPFEDDVIQMLKTDSKTLKPDAAIAKADVVAQLHRLPSDSNGNRYNNHQCAFFENRLNLEMQQFLEQPDLHAVRYYFGYDNSHTSYFASNRIRVILIGVDSEGRNIVPSLTRPESTVWMLQKSWPPPPPDETL